MPVAIENILDLVCGKQLIFILEFYLRQHNSHFFPFYFDLDPMKKTENPKAPLVLEKQTCHIYLLKANYSTP